MLRLLLNDNTIIEEGRAGVVGDSLWLFLPGYTMQQAAEKALNPDVMKRIVWEYGSDQEVYTGYTNCKVLNKDADEISVCMEKG